MLEDTNSLDGAQTTFKGFNEILTFVSCVHGTSIKMVAHPSLEKF